MGCADLRHGGGHGDQCLSKVNLTNTFNRKLILMMGCADLRHGWGRERGRQSCHTDGVRRPPSTGRGSAHPISVLEFTKKKMKGMAGVVTGRVRMVSKQLLPKLFSLGI